MGQSARAFCREQGGGKRSIFYKRRDRSLERIAAFLNMQRAGKMTALTSPPDKSAAVGHEEAKFWANAKEGSAGRTHGRVRGSCPRSRAHPAAMCRDYCTL
jgi:hypothetical protein